MMRKFRKGLAIFLILCLLVNGAAGHDCSANPKLREDFGNCMLLENAAEDEAFGSGSRWFAVNDTDNDVMIGYNWVGVVSLRVCYDHINNVYRCCVWVDGGIRRLLTYFDTYKLWYDRDEMIYFDTKTGFFYTPPVLSAKSRGVYGYLDTDELTYYRNILTKAALDDIQKFKTQLNDIWWQQLTKAVTDKSVRAWDLPW